MANLMYQNISDEERLYRTSDGAKRIVVPGDVFETDIEQTSSWFKPVDESSFKPARLDELAGDVDVIRETPSGKHKRRQIQ